MILTKIMAHKDHRKLNKIQMINITPQNNGELNLLLLQSKKNQLLLISILKPYPKKISFKAIN
jgi:hypothetical protein